MKRTLACVILELLIALIPTTLIGWGREGHAIVGELAQRHLTPDALNGVKALLGNDTLASVASWADDIRSQRDETYNWHFVDIPKSAASFDEQRDWERRILTCFSDSESQSLRLCC